MSLAEQARLVVDGSDEHPELALEDDESLYEDFEIVSGKIVGSSRWSNHRETIWKFTDGSYLKVEWQEGATEYQEDHPAGCVATVVEPFEKTVVDYRPVK